MASFRRIRRSMLYIPGHTPRMFAKATELKADAVIFELQEAVPDTEKGRARELVQEALKTIDFKGMERTVRINFLDSEHAEKDIEAMVDAQPDALVVPKCHGLDEIETAARLLDKYETDSSKGKTKIMPLIESARGILSINETVFASTRITAILFGKEDIYAETGARMTRNEEESLYWKSRLVLAAKAAGLDAIDSPSLDIENKEAIIRESKLAAQLGFDGKQVIHPNQIDAVNRAFIPSDEEIQEAKEIIAALEESRRGGAPVVRFRGKMFDPANVEPYVRLVEKWNCLRSRYLTE